MNESSYRGLGQSDTQQARRPHRFKIPESVQEPAPPPSVGGAATLAALRPSTGGCSSSRHHCGRRMQGLLGAEPRGLGEGAQVAAILSCEPCHYDQR